ncbi:flagellin [Aquibium carbonis]|uniref:Flagellin n=1 Tax=Aquibium carbonis TaxID=2495581 RepID=A0A3S0A7X1_9HYPH|nr:flagellin [Aquibium carbonis]RST85847.1 flagellin [Aquibium carbonis]
MASINTNVQAMTALKALNATNKALESTQTRISTGFKVGEASDNAAYWSIATTMRSDNKALGTVKDALGLGQAKIDTAYTGMNAAIEVVDEIKTKLVAASEPGVDQSKINKEITALKDQLVSITSSASFSGENWLANDGAVGTKSIVGSFTRDASGFVSIGTLDVDVNAVTLTSSDDAANGILTKDIDADALQADPTGTADNYFLLNTSSTTAATGTEIALTGTNTKEEIGAMVRAVDSILSQMTDAAADLGAAKKRVSLQNEFVTNLSDTISKGVGTLVDADMSQESTRLQALQVQQQLGIQALSIANGNSQTILSLFR